MNGLAEVIPLDSRRRRGKRRGQAQEVRVAAPVGPSPAVRRKRLLAFCGALLALIVALIVVDRVVLAQPRGAAGGLGAVAPPVRAALYQRTIADLAATCGLPAARAGLLREHCVDQARFVTAFPECIAECRRLAQVIIRGR